MKKEITLRDLMDESLLKDYFYEAIKNSLPKTQIRKDALNVFGIQNGLYSIIETDGEAWYDATVEQAEPEDLGDAVRFIFIVHGENKEKCFSFSLPKPVSRGDSDV